MSDSITVVRAKYSRAMKHFKEFNFELVRWSEADAMTVRRERKGDTLDVWTLIAVTQPRDLALIIGDCLTNAMAVLDYIAFAVCDGHSKTPKDQRKIFFPLLDSRKAYRAGFKTDKRYQAIRSWAVRGAMTRIEASQPYHRTFFRPGLHGPIAEKRKGPDWHPLRWLDTLVNIDKHRYLHVTTGGNRSYHMASPPHISFQVRYPAPFDGFRPLVVGTELLRVAYASERDAQMAVEPKFTADIFFDDPQLAGSPIYRKPVRYVIGTIMSCLFSEVIPRFRPYL